MAKIELIRLQDVLDDDDRKEIESALSELGAPDLDLDDSAEEAIIAANLDEDIFIFFADQLDAADVSADIYLPVEFEDVFEVGDVRVGSSYSLLTALDELREEIGVEEVEDDEEDEEEIEVSAGDDDFESLEDLDNDSEPSGGGLFSEESGAEELKDEHMQHIWRVVYKGARASINRSVCLQIRA